MVNKEELESLRIDLAIYKSWFLPIVKATGELTDYRAASDKALEAIKKAALSEELR